MIRCGFFNLTMQWRRHARGVAKARILGVVGSLGVNGGWLFWPGALISECAEAGEECNLLLRLKLDSREVVPAAPHYGGTALGVEDRLVVMERNREKALAETTL